MHRTSLSSSVLYARCTDMHIRALMVNRATDMSTEEKTGLFNRIRYLTGYWSTQRN